MGRKEEEKHQSDEGSADSLSAPWFFGFVNVGVRESVVLPSGANQHGGPGRLAVGGIHKARGEAWREMASNRMHTHTHADAHK